jgi:hypothetical protein
LIIGALTAIFWDGMPIIGDSIWNSKFTDWNPIQYYTTRSTLIVEYAAVLAVLGSIDSLLICRQYEKHGIIATEN